MAQKIVWVPEIGELLLSKRRGSKNIRLSINSQGKVRVGLPAWVPYSAGIKFALSRSDWILKHRGTELKPALINGGRIGKSYRLEFKHNPSLAKTISRISPGLVRVASPKPLSSSSVQEHASKAAERAIKLEAEKLLPHRLAVLANRYDFSYKEVRIKKLTSRWGSCSSDKKIILNYYLMQLPWEMIDYVLIHELVHTKYLNHSLEFWQSFEKIYPDAKSTRKQMKNYKPVMAALAN